MTKILKCLVVLMAVIVTFGSLSCEASRRTVAILPVENKSNENTYDLSTIMAEQLTVSLHNSGSYNVVERTELGQIMKEGGFQHSGAVDTSTAIELGQLAGAKYSLITTITMLNVDENPKYKYTPNIKIVKNAVNRYRAKIAMTVRLIDNETGKDTMVSSIEVSGTADETKIAVHEACVEAAKKVLKDIQKYNPFTAKVIKIEGKKLYIDQGFDAGIRVGETLEIVREGSPIIKNGKVVDMTHISIGKAKITEVTADYSICKVIEATETIKVNDILKRAK